LTTSGLVTAGSPAADSGRLAVFIMVAGDVLRVWGPNRERFDRVREEVRQRLGLTLDQTQVQVGPLPFHDVTSEALVFPTRAAGEAAAAKVLEHAQRYYEETWAHQPRKSLAGNTPIDAAGHTNLRKKLRGVVRFLQDCAADGMLANYDFDRLRRKLGLLEGAAPAPSAAPGAPADVAAMGAAELAALKAETLTDDQLEQAYQAAHKLDAEELAASFARALTARPPRPDRPDRFAWYAYLTQHALKSGDKDAALDYVNEGEKADCEQNEGRRRNDYELRRGQVHVKRGEADAAADVFRRLIERVPTEMKYRVSATEGMLALTQGGQALRFAEEGVEAARKQNDRDAEQHLLELAGAARKQTG
jgi:hypothetical protein